MLTLPTLHPSRNPLLLYIFSDRLKFDQLLIQNLALYIQKHISNLKRSTSLDEPFHLRTSARDATHKRTSGLSIGANLQRLESGGSY